jgi:hypothetical protein
MGDGRSRRSAYYTARPCAGAIHDGAPFAAADVARHQGANAALRTRQMQAVGVVDAQPVRFRLHQPWPGFLTCDGTPASGSGGTASASATRRPRTSPAASDPSASSATHRAVDLVLAAHPHC